MDSSRRIAAPAPSVSFVSDNWSGAHPEVFEALIAANGGQAPSYGGDAWTTRFREVAKRVFGENAEAFPVFNGTGANVLALQAALPRWGAVICARSAHIAADETGAPEKAAGIKLLPVETPDGKLTPELVDREAWGWGDIHRAQPGIVSIAQVTEFGTCYTVEELRALADHAHERGMLLHLDGSRLPNAAAHLEVSLAALTAEVGVDLLSLGGTKHGLLGAEAVIAFRPEVVAGMEFLRKIDLQLASKMRFVSAQLLALYDGDLWRRSAAHANAMASRLAAGIEELIAQGTLPGLEIMFPVESNAVFATVPPEAAARAQQRFVCGAWAPVPNLYRFMCAFDTSAEDVDALLATLSG
ncbi:threonine aldolase [Mycobacterium frederiksbergense]|uniref:Threonine aldolase n=1 Tax=Mycolicibacterium frederiksbergense TaxID=117567 RepID=A0ABT6L8S9_9MYCO|nr:beta-eliminating lyase-related protein [Mycolicibacterium frederiksbergense]MDH6199293.1 threonine aldolase [Mycolicibacterium frederiksbergense]